MSDESTDYNKAVVYINPVLLCFYIALMKSVQY